MQQALRSRAARSVLLALALVVWGALGMAVTELAARATEQIRITVAIKNRKVDPEQKTIRVRQGDGVELIFTSDEPAELHLHGYDRTIEVVPGTPAPLRLDARIGGRFPVEAHRFGAPGAPAGRKHNHATLFYLEVHPR